MLRSRSVGPGLRAVAKRAELAGGHRAAALGLRRTLRGNGPVVVGPWTSEVGFELLYWIPFLRRLRDRGLLDPDRTIALSRGGVDGWYADVAAGYLELHDLLGTDAVIGAASPPSGRSLKQVDVTGFERRALEQTRAALGRNDIAFLHPRIMYRRFRPTWNERYPIARVLEELAFARHQAPAPPLDLELPSHYVVVKPYTSGILPAHGNGAEAFATLVAALAEHVPVVLARAGRRLDDHEDIALPSGAGVTDLPSTLDPARNLAVQTAVVAGAQALISTYGGFSYLGLLLGVPTFGVFETPRYGHVHHRVARALVESLGDAELTLVSTDHIRRLAALVAR